MIATFTDLILRVILAAILSIPFGSTGIWCAWPIGWTVGTAFDTVARFFEPVKAEEVIRLKQYDKTRLNIIFMSVIRALQHCNF